jgi:hypothetical protein
MALFRKSPPASGQVGVNHAKDVTGRCEITCAAQLAADKAAILRKKSTFMNWKHRSAFNRSRMFGNLTRSQRKKPSPSLSRFAASVQAARDHFEIDKGGSIR